MTDPVSRWLQNSREAMAIVERELKQHNCAVEAAMATIRSHGDMIDKLERSLEIIGRAIAEAEAGIAREHVDDGPTRPNLLDRSAAPVGTRPEAPQLRAVSET